MELFREDGCLTDEGLLAVTKGGLDELGRLETAEHLSYCDRCMDRYTALLTADALETPPKPLRGAVMSNIWVRLMQNHLWPGGRGQRGGGAGADHVEDRCPRPDHPPWLRTQHGAAREPDTAGGRRPSGGAGAAGQAGRNAGRPGQRREALRPAAAAAGHRAPHHRIKRYNLGNEELDL